MKIAGISLAQRRVANSAIVRPSRTGRRWHLICRPETPAPFLPISRSVIAFRLAPPANPGLDLDALAAVTYSAVFSDVCDRMGLRNQTVAPGILPLGGWRHPDRLGQDGAEPARR
jgi:hypothetical protein